MTSSVEVFKSPKATGSLEYEKCAFTQWQYANEGEWRFNEDNNSPQIVIDYKNQALQKPFIIVFCVEPINS